MYRLACQVTDSVSMPGSPSGSVSPGETLSKRCVSIVKTALKPEIWPSKLLFHINIYYVIVSIAMV